MLYYARSLANLIGELEKLPNVGPKTAQRFAYYLLRVTREDAERLANAILEVKDRIRYCQTCYNFTEQEQCEICRDSRRDPTIVFVVAEPRDLVALEKTGFFHGRYHVLHGVIAPMEGVGPEDLRIKELLARIRDQGVQEVILGLNPTVEGDTTAMYLGRLLQPLGVKVTQMAHGLPVGGDMDYADQATLIQSIQGRREV